MYGFIPTEEINNDRDVETNTPQCYYVSGGGYMEQRLIYGVRYRLDNDDEYRLYRNIQMGGGLHISADIADEDVMSSIALPNWTIANIHNMPS